MVCIIEFELEPYLDYKWTTGHEQIQQYIQATHCAYSQLMQEWRVNYPLFPVYSILDRIGCIVADVPQRDWPKLNSMSYVKCVRESKLHQRLGKCDN